MKTNPLGKNVDQLLSSLGATQITHESRVDVGGERYDSVNAVLPDGGRIEGKLVGSGASQLSWVDVFDTNGRRSENVTFGRAGFAQWADTFSYATERGFSLTAITTDWDKQGDGEADGREIWKKGEGTHREIDSDGDGHIDKVGPTWPDR